MQGIVGFGRNHNVLANVPVPVRPGRAPGLPTAQPTPPLTVQPAQTSNQSGSILEFIRTNVIHFGAKSLKQRAEKHYPVLVVGGGVAGLTAMYELVNRKGIPAVLMESTNRLGGNSKTGISPQKVPHPAGATIFIPGDPVHRKLWKELDLPLTPEMILKPEIFINNGERFTAFALGGKKIEIPATHPENQEAARGFRKMLKDLKTIAAKVKNAPVIPIQTATEGALKKWDRISLAEFLDKYGPKVRQLAEPYIQSDLAASSDEVSAYVGMIDLEDLNQHRYVLPGGNGFITNRLAEEIVKGSGHEANPKDVENPLQVNNVVEWVEQQGKKVYVKYRDVDKKLHVVSADHVLMAAPYNKVPKLMELPKRYAALMNAIPKSSYSIVNIHFKTTPLKTHQFYMLPNSKTISDLVVTSAVPGENRDPDPGTPSVMSIYTAHTGRRKDKKAFAKEIVKEIKATFPEITDNIISGVQVNPFKFSMASTAPGQVKALKELPRTFGQVTLINSDGGAVPSILTAVHEALLGVETAIKDIKPVTQEAS